jgi:hypothetical protein
MTKANARGSLPRGANWQRKDFRRAVVIVKSNARMME